MINEIKKLIFRLLIISVKTTIVIYIFIWYPENF